MTSPQTLDQNFEVIDSVFVDDQSSCDNESPVQPELPSPPTFVIEGEDFQSIDVTNRIESSTANGNGNFLSNATDLGMSLVIVSNESTGSPKYEDFTNDTNYPEARESFSFPMTTNEEVSLNSGGLSSSFSVVMDQNNKLVSALEPKSGLNGPRPSSDWEIMNNSIILQQDLRLQPETASNEYSFSDKLKLMWNNARFKVKSSDIWPGISESQPIFLLSQGYNVPQKKSSEKFNLSHHTAVKGGEVGQFPTVQQEREFDKFRVDFRSLVWITYRKNFAALPRSELVSDLGWGCMIRSGQMMLAQAFVKHWQPENWRYGLTNPNSYSAENTRHRQIIRWFADCANENSPFSIHRLTELSQNHLSKRPGDWFGPFSIAVVLKKALEEAGRINKEIGQIGMYVAQDCTCYLGDMLQMTKDYRAIIVFVPVRLGMNEFDLSYQETLKAFLRSKFCLGIIGGKPKHSLYFVGYQGSSLIYLDPHYCQPFVDVDSNPYQFEVKSYHCDTPQKTSFSNIDPSLALGFMFETDKYYNFVAEMRSILGLKLHGQAFVLSEGKLADHHHECNQLDDLVSEYGIEDDELSFHNSEQRSHKFAKSKKKMSTHIKTSPIAVANEHYNPAFSAKGSPLSSCSPRIAKTGGMIIRKDEDFVKISKH